MGFKRIFDALGEEESVSKSLPMPQFKYHESLGMWFVLPDGSCHQVGTADIEDLILFLADCSAGMKAKIVRRDLLKMLEDDSSPECRFYCLLEFKHYKCPMGLSVAFVRKDTMCRITAVIAPVHAHLTVPTVDTLALYEQFHCRGEKSLWA